MNVPVCCDTRTSTRNEWCRSRIKQDNTWLSQVRLNPYFILTYSIYISKKYVDGFRVIHLRWCCCQHSRSSDIWLVRRTEWDVTEDTPTSKEIHAKWEVIGHGKTLLEVRGSGAILYGRPSILPDWNTTFFQSTCISIICPFECLNVLHYNYNLRYISVKETGAGREKNGVTGEGRNNKERTGFLSNTVSLPTQWQATPHYSNKNYLEFFIK